MMCVLTFTAAGEGVELDWVFFLAFALPTDGIAEHVVQFSIAREFTGRSDKHSFFWNKNIYKY